MSVGWTQLSEVFEVYDTKKLLRQHYQRLHCTQRFACDSCQLRFSLERELKYHQRTVHATEEKKAHRKRKQTTLQREEPITAQPILLVPMQQSRQAKEKVRIETFLLEAV